MQMKKLKISAVANHGNLNSFAIEKRQEFFTGFRRLLKKMGFNGCYALFLGRPTDKDGEAIEDRELPIGKFNDVLSHFENDNFKISVVYGRKKIFLFVVCDSMHRRTFINNLMEFCYVEKVAPKRFKKKLKK